jgi:hypothetical protein
MWLVACRRDFVTDRSFANPRLNSETHSTRFALLALAQGRLWGSHFHGGANEMLATGHWAAWSPTIKLASLWRALENGYHAAFRFRLIRR